MDATVFWKNYQEKAWTFATESSQNIAYLIGGLLGESGEVSDKVKKLIRGDFGDSLTFDTSFAQELGDCLWYIFGIASLNGYPLSEISGFRHPEQELLLPHANKVAGCVLLLTEAVKLSSMFVVGDDILPDTSQVAPFKYAIGASRYLRELSCLAAIVGLNLYTIADMNMDKLSKRLADGKIMGSGDNR